MQKIPSTDNIIVAVIVYVRNGSAIGIGDNSDPIRISGQPNTPPPSAPTRPLTDFVPCSPTVICTSQCVPYGTKPRLILGRVLADQGRDAPIAEWSEYKRSIAAGNSANETNNGTFASGEEYENVQWQISYDNSNWSDLSHETWTNYQPGPCTQITYYRRVSTHIRVYKFSPDRREYWYTSEVVTITPGPITPTQAQLYTTCGSFPISVAVNSNSSVASYNWYSVDPAWDIDGQGSSHTTAGASVQITPPANVADGTYTFNVIAYGTSGTCNQSSGTVSITIDHSASTPAPTSAIFIDATPNKTCGSLYNLSTPYIPGTIAVS